MLRLISKIEVRRLKLIERLYEFEEYITITELSQSLNCSTAIIRSDVSVINEEFSSIKIIIDNNKLKLNIPDSYGIDIVYKHIFTTSLSFKTIDAFFSEKYNIYELADHLHISVSTLYRTIKMIEKVLSEEYNLEVETSPCRLVGEESNVRNFYNQLYAEKFNVLEWPFSKWINESNMETFCNKLLNIVPYENTYSIIRTMKLMFSINLIRMSQGHYIDYHEHEINDSVIEAVINNESLNTYLSQMVQNRLTKEKLIQITFKLSQKSIVYSYNDLYQRSSDNPLLRKSFSQLSFLFLSLSSKYQIQITDIDELIVNVHNSAALGQSDYLATSILSSPKTQLLSLFQKTNPTFYHELKLLLEEYISDVFDNNNNDVLVHLMYIVFMNWKELYTHLETLNAPVKAYVFSDLDAYHANFIKNYVEYHSSNLLTAEVLMLDSYIHIKDFIEDDDIIITNFTIKHDHPYSLSFKNPPTRNDIDKLNKMISEINISREIDPENNLL